MTLSSPTSLIPIALIVGLVVSGVWIQVRARIRAKRAIEASQHPSSPSGADAMTSNQNVSGLLAGKHIAESMLNGGGFRGNGYKSP